MQRIGVTGHVHLPPSTASWVEATLLERLRDTGRASRTGQVQLHGVTCLAKGADQLFADVVLALQGSLYVIVPARDYLRVVTEAGAGDAFSRLLGSAASVVTLPFERSCRAAYVAASEAMLDDCDLLIAVWDGRPSRAAGDTADVVARARRRPLPVEVIWPGPGEVI